MRQGRESKVRASRVSSREGWRWSGEGEISGDLATAVVCFVGLERAELGRE